MLLLNLSDTATTSQDGSSLEIIAAIAGRQCFIQDASGRGLCMVSGNILKLEVKDKRAWCLLYRRKCHRRWQSWDLCDDLFRNRPAGPSCQG